MAASVRSRSGALVLGVTLALAWVGWSAWVHRGHWVDDAFISFRYAANWLGGHGLVFDPGERVEGITNLGWVWTLTGAGAVLPVSLPTLAKALGLIFLGTAVVLAALAYRRLVPEASGAELALLPVLTVSSPELVYFSLAGMETGLAALLLVAGLGLLTGERPRVPTAGLLAGLLFAVRPEAIVLFPLFALALLARPGDVRRSRVLGALGLFAAAVTAVTLFRLGYYGEPLPNTFVAKSPGGVGAVAERAWAAFVGRHVNLPAPWVGSVLALLGGAGAWALLRPTSRNRRPAALFLIAGVLTGAAFAAYAPADWTDLGRYFAPYVPFAAALVLRGLFALATLLPRRLPSLSPRAGHLAAVLVALLFAAVGLGRTQAHLGADALADYPGFVLTSDGLTAPSRWIGETLPPDAVVAARRIGALGYFGELPVLDYAFGLTDPEVARLRRRSGSPPFASPGAPELAPLWERRAPDCLLEDGDVIARLRTSGSPNRIGDRIAVHGVVYREVRRFPLGDGSVDWVLACRPGTVSGAAARPGAGGSIRGPARSRPRRATPPP